MILKPLLNVLIILSIISVICGNVPPTNDVGINLSPMNVDTSQLVFTDLFKHSQPFYPMGTNNAGVSWILARQSQLDISLNGYPAVLTKTNANSFQAAVTQIGSQLPQFLGQLYKNGKYFLLYDGTGDFMIDGDGSIDSQSQGQISVTVTISTGIIYVRLISTLTSNPVQNIRLIPQEYESTYLTTNVFHPDFIDSIKKFKIIRFAGSWQNEIWNSGSTPDWNQRTTQQSQTQSWTKWVLSGGVSVALEHMVDLVTQEVKDAWFCIPWNADDNYVNQFATYLFNNIPASQKIYIQFSHGQGWGGVTKHAAGINRLNTLFTQIFTGDRRTQLFFVVILDITDYWPHVRPTFNDDFSQVDAFAMDGQFGYDLRFDTNDPDMAKFKDYTTETILSELQRSVLEQQVTVNKIMHQIRKAGKSIMAYAAGPSVRAARYGWRWKLRSLQNAGGYVQNQTLQNLATWEGEFAQKLIEINRHQEMRQITLDYLRRWKAVGGGSLVATSLVGAPDLLEHGYLSLLESIAAQDQTTSPKYMAFIDFIDGKTSTLPLTSADLPPITPPSCTPACQWGTCVTGNTCQCFYGYKGATCQTYDDKSLPNKCIGEVGLNLGGIAYWANEWIFTDIQKMSSEWIPQEADSYVWNTGRLDQVTFDSNDYPLTMPNNVFVGTMMVRDLQGGYEKGIYVVLYDGDAVLVFHMDCIKNVKRSVGRIELTVEPTLSPNNGIFMRCEWNNPLDPLRNVRIIRPGFEEIYQQEPFHPFFLQQIERFKVLRFMDWMRANDAKTVTWEERPQPSHRTYTQDGAPVQVMVALCNRLGTDCWFNLPAQINDDYITKFATYVRDNLRPDVKVYVEYANEVWGTQFVGGQYCQEQGIALNLSNDPTQARFCYYAIRSKEIFTIFQTVFGGKSRLFFLLATQAVNADTTKRILECGNAFEQVDAVAIAPYFSVSFNSTYNPTLDNLMNIDLPQEISQMPAMIKTHKDLTDAQNIKLITYESGQHLVSQFSTQQTDLCISANRDPRMESLYKTYLNMLKDSGISMITHFSSIGRFSQYGSWGLQELQNQNPTTAPKMRAITSFLDSTAKCPDRVTYSNCPQNCGDTSGQCLENGQCGCYVSYYGQDCGGVKLDDLFDCGYQCTFDNGVCSKYETIGTTNMWQCICKSGWTGYYCNQPVCQDNCNNNGLCTQPDQCQCYDGYTGDTCSTNCNCGERGRCDPSNSSRCICDQGFIYSDKEQTCVFDCQCRNPAQKCVAPGECSCLNDCGQNGLCLQQQCICNNGYTGASCQKFVGRSVNNGTIVGLNIGGLADYSTQQPFLDYFKTSRQWISQYNHYKVSSRKLVWDNQDKINQDENGFITQLDENQVVGTMLLRDLKLNYPAGDYVLFFEGDGDLEIYFDAKIVSRRQYSMRLQVKPQLVRDNGIYIVINRTNPENPIRNFKLVEAKNEFIFERKIWNDKFLEPIKRFSGFRYMDMLHINNQKISKWADRNTPSKVSQARPEGLSFEYLVDLSNRLGTDAWICVPHLADDDYVTNLAQYLQTNLRTDLRIYVELSNEVWNPLFDQGQWAIAKAKERIILAGEVYSSRSIEIFRIFTKVFGNEARQSRLVYILSTQTVSTWLSTKILQYKDAYKQADALGLTSYFDCGLTGTSQAPQVLQMTLTEMFKQCQDSFQENLTQIQQQVDLAAKYFLAPIFYEGGPTLLEQQTIESAVGAETPGVADKFISMHRDPRMRDIYLDFLTALKGFGFLDQYPVFHFSSIGLPSKYGSWGLLEYMEQDPKTAPKYQAVMTFLDQTGPVYLIPGCTNRKAINYNPDAKINDNSCQFEPVPIGFEGGQIDLNNISINFPPMAINGEIVKISVDEVRNPAKANNIVNGYVIKLGPAGTKFDKPVTICLQNDGFDPSQKLTLYFTSDEINWQPANNTNYFASDQKVCGDLMHFTMVGAMDQDTIPTIDISSDQDLHAQYGTINTPILMIATLCGILLFN